MACADSRAGAGGAAGENQGEPNQDRAEEAATGQCPRPAEPAELLVRCVSARIRRQSATRQGIPRRMALSYLPRPAGKRGNGDPVKRQIDVPPAAMASG